MSKKADLQNKKFSRLLVLKDVGRTKAGSVLWLCLCDCGKETTVRSAELINGHVRSCGCLCVGAPIGNKHGLGTKRTPEVRAKMSKSLTGRTFSPEHCANISKSITEEFRANTSLRMSGKGNPMYGKSVSDGTRKKISLAGIGNKNNLGHKHSEETRKKMSDDRKGESHPNWRGGTTKDPYCPIFQSKDFRAMVLERDNNECQNPDCWNVDARICLHHIDYDRRECKLDNLITLCHSCNMRANYDREWNMLNYQELIKMKEEGIRRQYYGNTII